MDRGRYIVGTFYDYQEARMANFMNRGVLVEMKIVPMLERMEYQGEVADAKIIIVIREY